MQYTCNRVLNFFLHFTFEIANLAESFKCSLYSLRWVDEVVFKWLIHWWYPLCADPMLTVFLKISHSLFAHYSLISVHHSMKCIDYFFLYSYMVTACRTKWTLHWVAAQLQWVFSWNDRSLALTWVCLWCCVYFLYRVIAGIENWVMMMNYKTGNGDLSTLINKGCGERS